jgi:hypothetical protein
MNLQVLQNVGKFLSSYVTVSFSRRIRLHEASLVSELIVAPTANDAKLDTKPLYMARCERRKKIFVMKVKPGNLPGD